MPTGILFGQVAVVLGVALFGIWTATQWTANALAYQSQLGSPWFDLSGTPVYRPWQLFEWCYFYHAYAPDVFVRGGAIAASRGILTAGALERRNHCEKTSHALLVGAILHVLYAGSDKTLRGVANFLSEPDCPFDVTLYRMMQTNHLGDTPHPVVASAAREVLNKSENERSGVLSTAMSFLGLYRARRWLKSPRAAAGASLTLFQRSTRYRCT